MRLTLPHLSLKGAGRVYGYILNSAAGGRIQEIEFSQCSQPGCTAAAVDDAQPWVMRFDDDKLPAGDYELMVLADGAPVRVALTLDTLSEVNDNPLDVQPLTAEVLSPTPIVNESERRVYVAGAFSKFETPSFAVLGMWATSNPHVVTAFGNCTQYARTFEAQSDVALSPACPVVPKAWVTIAWSSSPRTA